MSIGPRTINNYARKADWSMIVIGRWGKKAEIGIH